MIKNILIRENILGTNDQIARENQRILDNASIFSINVMASPGAGKTSLIERTVDRLKDIYSVAVVDGDLASSIDAERAAKAGARAFQINTGGACHLDAIMLNQALSQIPLNLIDLLIVENVGNLVCPINFMLGVHKSILIASIPEGDDKPYKYPNSYRNVDVVIVNKIDLLPYISFNVEYFRRGIELLNPGVTIIELSCQTGQGLENWFKWVEHECVSFHQSAL
jgi:hydrogenase nickel incorporation protein HypB